MSLQPGAQAVEVIGGSSLVGLPLDLQTYLLSFVTPLDILRLRMTCRAFYNVTSQQIVWIEALRQTCLASAVFLPTFPLDEMELEELEHAAVAPNKWLSLASARDGSGSMASLNTHRLRYLSPLSSGSLNSDEVDTAEEDDFEVRSLFLVPGGRYLVTFTWRWVCVWDIGFSPDPDDDYIDGPIDKVKVDLHSMTLVHASPDGEALRIFVSCPAYRNEQKLADVLHVYEIYPQRVDAELELIARLEVVGEEKISFYSLSGDCYVFLHGSVLKIWNFKTNAWGSWTVQGEFHQVMITPTFIILIQSTGVSIWRIPRLVASSPLFSFVNPTPLPPVINIPYTVSRPPGEDHYAGPDDWYSGTPLPNTYDVATPISLDAVHLQRYEVVVNNDLSYATLIENSSAVIPARDDDNLSLEPYRFCLDSLVTWWFEPHTDTMKIYTGPLGPRATPDTSSNQHLHGVQTAAIPSAATATSFCPMSGRFVYLDDDDESLEGVVILDFLKPIGMLRSDNNNARPAPHADPDNNLMEGRWRDELTAWNGNMYSLTQF